MIDRILPAISPSLPVAGADVASQSAPVSGTDGIATRRASTIGAGDGLTTDFSSVLAQVAVNAVETLKASEATSVAGIRGQAPVQQVVESIMAAEQTLQSAIAIRDKVVAAYLELSRMQI